MKWASVVGGLALACAASLSGHAADITPVAPAPYRAAPAYIPAYFSWTGYYLGATIGDGFGNATMLDPSILTGATGQFVSERVKGFLAGGYAGVNYQVGSIVFGFDADFIGSWAKGAAADTLPAPVADIMQVEILWTGTATARVGWAIDRLLFYGKGGAAFVFHRDTIAGGNNGGGSATTATWTVGGGIDWAVTEHWIARAEYDYFNMPTTAFQLATTPPAASQMGGKFNEIRLGMAYKF
jgi:outer membrane immunogenic protein